MTKTIELTVVPTKWELKMLLQEEFCEDKDRKTSPWGNSRQSINNKVNLFKFKNPYSTTPLFML